ncbi:MAG: hypothetical protein ACNS60_13945 [Candidatus Cyclobacteriaceae bacterium M2_1C_046]
MEEIKVLQLIGYLEGTLNSEERRNVRLQLENDPELRMELEKLEELYATMEREKHPQVPGALREDFYTLLDKEKRNQKNRYLWISWAGKIAAAVALIAAGFWLGLSLQDNDKHTEQITALKKEINSNRHLILNAMDQPTASQRFMAVNASENITKPDQEIINALVKVMNTDDNTNVRLAAVRALSRYGQEEKVRKELISSLLTQSDPLVQVALIEILVELGEKQVVPTLERLIKTDTTLETVRDEAYWGVMKLAST